MTNAALPAICPICDDHGIIARADPARPTALCPGVGCKARDGWKTAWPSGRIVKATPEETELRRVTNAARQRASAVGPMHSLWDPIVDAESLLADKPTFLQYENRETAISTLIGLLRA